jgi:hypothetical protein
MNAETPSSRFGPGAIHNTQNVVRVSAIVNQRIATTTHLFGHLWAGKRYVHG